ncbi:MAG: hypothetical protein JO091_01470 [Acidobacteriaceae bacterium]|nr:hypothetical protein [Acidobacteriaceae bacterium]
MALRSDELESGLPDSPNSVRVKYRFVAQYGDVFFVRLRDQQLVRVEKQLHEQLLPRREFIWRQRVEKFCTDNQSPLQ